MIFISIILSIFHDDCKSLLLPYKLLQMPLQPAIPPLLSTYLSSRVAESLIFLTSTLGVSTNWLALRHIYAVLQSCDNDGGRRTEYPGEMRVVLASWLRDTNFWKDGGRKLVRIFTYYCSRRKGLNNHR